MIDIKKKDYTGQRFGKLLIQEMLYDNKYSEGKTRKRAYCRSLCDCGNEVICVVDNIVFGTKRSCGCDTKDRRVQANRKDLTGQKFGRLFVEGMEWGKDGKGLAHCVCDCGNRLSVNSADVSSGHTQSCGCLQRERTTESNTKDWAGIISPAGIQFLRQAKQNKAGQWLWECKCGMCSNKFIALPAKVMEGVTTSCGCKIRSSGEETIKQYLDKNDIEYKMQYSFPDCKDKYKLKFVFAVFTENNLSCLIEYDGKQHFQPIEYFGGEDGYTSSVHRDEIKNLYCKKNNINLIRIPYTYTISQIEETLSNTIYP